MSRISRGLAEVPADLAALLTVTYTTDDPSITPNGALAIADGDAASVTRAEYNELAEEVELALATIRTKVNAILAYLEAVSEDNLS